MQISVRRALIDDAEAIAAVQSAARLVGYRDFVDARVLIATYTQDFTARWQQRLVDPEHEVFVAVVEDQVVGCCMLAPPQPGPKHGADDDGPDHEVVGDSTDVGRGRDSPEDASVDDAGPEDAGVELSRMSVSPKCWRSGVGRALVRAAIDGKQTVTLWVIEQNHQALAFYEGLGFKPDGAEMVDSWSRLRQLRLRRQAG